MNNSTSKRSPFLFFVLVYALSIPLWVLNIIYPIKLPVDNLPLTDIVATFSPMVAACILVYREEKLLGVKNLLKRTFDYKRIKKKVWYVPIIFLMPFIYVLAYVIMRLVGLPVPAVWNPPLLTPLLFIAFFLAAAGEELGYSGYVTDPMQVRYTTLTASIIIGLIHGVWHFPSMLSMGMSPGLFIWGGFILAVSFRILTVWLYNNTGKSVFATILFHAVTNTGRSIFPGSRSVFQLYDGAIGYGLIAITAVIVVFLWGPETLTRIRYARKAA
ncbi:CPBP family intramembrane metalloprotease [Methanosarcina sp. MSH10X1]|uniref:CPBP family intramembrane glutamic endopeptidase n=1 Tax=Methanosarcina sp. MSH10X1 TaxID=2507075 RepID=UPI000FFB6359|nr:CPBP family intramembrane glutamic endopeptidase [Methanosarcina sp. MSH10X1]RXA18489.1 CPBP family intramembrane metalloprotease [Methanosarcina sp. MSH10X1]